MPLVRIDLLRGRDEAALQAISAAVHRALVETMNVPERDRFHVLTEHDPGRLIFDPAYLGVERTAGIVVVQVFLSRGRTTEQKQAFYARAQALLTSEAGVRPGDATLTLVESTREDWSFGEGIAQYLVLPKAQWK
jgi:phenylpyruvate tautomerase PptA (4-oxalocrotonate tautomerase family)